MHQKLHVQHASAINVPLSVRTCRARHPFYFASVWLDREQVSCECFAESIPYLLLCIARPDRIKLGSTEEASLIGSGFGGVRIIVESPKRSKRLMGSSVCPCFKTKDAGEVGRRESLGQVNTD